MSTENSPKGFIRMSSLATTAERKPRSYKTKMAKQSTSKVNPLNKGYYLWVNQRYGSKSKQENSPACQIN